MIKEFTLRDQIAMSQLQALTSPYKFGEYRALSDKDMLDQRCEVAVEYADALIKELTKGRTE